MVFSLPAGMLLQSDLFSLPSDTSESGKFCRCDECRGSLTIYFALTFAVMVSLITACIYSAKVEAGRARVANAADQSVFSLFANYDQSLFDQYQIFMIDGSCGTGHLSTLTICKTLSENADYLLRPKKDHPFSRGSSLLSLAQTGCAITGCTLATDLNGLPFRAQAIRAEKDTFGLSGKGKSASHSAAASHPDAAFREEDANLSFTAYPKPNAADAGADSSGESPAVSSEAEVPPDFVNPLPILEALRQSSLLPLIIDESRHPVSDAAVVSSVSVILSRRPLEKGFGVINAEGAAMSGADKLLFQNYLLHHFCCFTDSFVRPSDASGLSSRSSGYSGLSCELEYLIGEQNTDRKNLEKTARKLLLQREGINFAYLQSDPEKHLQISQEALLIAASVGMPGAEPAIELLLSYAWTFAESLVDLYALLNGQHTAAVKTAASWQTQITDLPKLAGGIAPFVKDIPHGLSYRDCLGPLLSGKLLSRKSMDRLTFHAMDLIELSMWKGGNTGFRLDRCIDSLSFELSVASERKIPLTAKSSMSYRQSS